MEKLHLTITKRTVKKLPDSDRDYFWYKGDNDKGITYTFGSKDGSTEEGDVVDVNCEKRPRTGGGFTLVEVTE